MVLLNRWVATFLQDCNKTVTKSDCPNMPSTQWLANIVGYCGCDSYLTGLRMHQTTLKCIALLPCRPLLLLLSGILPEEHQEEADQGLPQVSYPEGSQNNCAIVEQSCSHCSYTFSFSVFFFFSLDGVKSKCTLSLVRVNIINIIKCIEQVGLHSNLPLPWRP